MLIYLEIVTVFLFIMGLIWSRNSWPNVFLKITFFGLSFWGGFLALQVAGFILQHK